MGCLPPFSAGARFRWPIHRIFGPQLLSWPRTRHVPRRRAVDRPSLAECQRPKWPANCPCHEVQWRSPWQRFFGDLGDFACEFSDLGVASQLPVCLVFFEMLAKKNTDVACLATVRPDVVRKKPRSSQQRWESTINILISNYCQYLSIRSISITVITYPHMIQ